MRRSVSNLLPSLANALARWSVSSSADTMLFRPQSQPQLLSLFLDLRQNERVRFHSTEKEQQTKTEKKENDTSTSSEEEQIATVDRLETDLPEVETEEAAKELKSQFQSILEEKDEALIQLSSQIEEEKKKVLLALAEAENLRTRFARESAQTKKFAVQGFVQNLLGSLDNLDRAIESIPAEFKNAQETEALDAGNLLNALNGLLTGVRMTQSEFRNVLQSHGVVRYDPVGEKFDPNEHMARFELDDPAKQPGTIGVVTVCGYKMHERIIRPAEVGVIRKRDEESASQVDEKTETGR